MDFFAHILWTVALFTIIGRKTGIKFNLKRAAFWGVFPDLFAFVLPALWVAVSFILGTFDISVLPQPENMEPVARDTLPVFQLAHSLYSISHSLIIFSGVILLIVLGAKIIKGIPIFSPGKIIPAAPREMGGWLFHILLDIPSHSYGFYPTPFLWPVSDFKLNGIAWHTPWFFALNYTAIILVYFYILRTKGKKAN